MPEASGAPGVSLNTLADGARRLNVAKYRETAVTVGLL